MINNKGILIKIRIIKGKGNNGKGNSLKKKEAKEMLQFFANAVDFNQFYMSLI